MMQQHKLLAFLLALVASVCLWFYAVTVVNPDDTITVSGIKVRIDGTDILEARELMLVGGEDLRVSVKLSGKRSDLKELNNDTLTAVASVARVTEAGDAEVSWSLEYPSNVAAGDISVESRSSYNVVVPVSRIAETDIPVRVDYRVTAAEGFWTDVSELICNTDSLTVRGPAEEVEAIDGAEVLLEAQNVEALVEREAQCVFVDADGAPLELSGYCTVSADKVNLVLPVYHCKEVELAVKLVAGGGVTPSDTECTVTPSRLLLTGSEEALAEADDKLEIARIELANYYGGVVPSVSMEAIRDLLPAGVTVRTEAISASISLQLVNISTRMITVPVERVIRLDDEETMQFDADAVAVHVRGRTEIVEAMTAEDLKVSADLKNDYDPETGMVTLKAEIVKRNGAALVREPFTARVVEVEPEE